MNRTYSNCFFFEDNFLHFDSTETVFITRILSCVVNCLFSLISSLGNLLILVVIRKTQDLHLPSFVLVGSLAASDLVVGLICQPLLVALNIAELKKNFNVFCYCRMLLFVTGWTTAGVSLLILTAISLDRLLALTLHLKYNTTVTVPRVFQTTFLFWSFCVFINVTRFWMTTKWYFISLAVFLLSFVVITVCTLNIFKIVRRHQRQINCQTLAVIRLQTNTVNILKCRKSAVTVLYIYALFLIVYLPFITLTIMELLIGMTRALATASMYAATVVFINSFLNPFVYCWRSREIRRAVKNILKRQMAQNWSAKWWALQKYVFEGAIQYFAGQRHRLLTFKTPVTLNWFSTRAW